MTQKVLDNAPECATISARWVKIRCSCGKVLGEAVGGMFRLRCRDRKCHEGKTVLVHGRVEKDAAVIEGITPDWSV